MIFHFGSEPNKNRFRIHTGKYSSFIVPIHIQPHLFLISRRRGLRVVYTLKGRTENLEKYILIKKDWLKNTFDKKSYRIL